MEILNCVPQKSSPQSWTKTKLRGELYFWCRLVAAAVTAIVAAVLAAVISAAAQNENQDDNPGAATAKTVVTHTVSLLLFISISSYGIRQLAVTVRSALI